MHEVVLIIYYVKVQIDNVPLGDGLFLFFTVIFVVKTNILNVPFFVLSLFFFFFSFGRVERFCIIDVIIFFL